jgi:NAD(P)-dependent dehydrogenase (short-subunit alcohol dehydrogenase family)
MEVIAVLGIGPGLGLSIAKRWAAKGYAVATVSRSPTRHDAYLAAVSSGSQAVDDRESCRTRLLYWPPPSHGVGAVAASGAPVTRSVAATPLALSLNCGTGKPSTSSIRLPSIGNTSMLLLP